MRRRQVEFGRVTTLVNKIKNMVHSFTTSQAIKAKVYKFRAQAATYTSAKSNSKRSLKLFQQRYQGLSSNARQYDSKFDLMLQDSKPPPPAGVLNTEDGYIEGRLDKQINNVYMKNRMTMPRRDALCTYEYAYWGWHLLLAWVKMELFLNNYPLSLTNW